MLKFKGRISSTFLSFTLLSYMYNHYFQQILLNMEIYLFQIQHKSSSSSIAFKQSKKYLGLNPASKFFLL